MSRASKSLLALVFAVALPQGSKANLLLNPSFEQPDLVQGSIQIFNPGATIGSGWVSQAGQPSIITDGYGSPGFYPYASDGDQFLYVNNGLYGPASLYQDVSLAAGTTYLLTFDLASYNQPLGLGAMLTIDVLLGGTSVLPNSAVFTRALSAGYGEQVLGFTTTSAGTYRLLLTATSGYGTLVDDFDLVAAAAVPEPSSLALAAAGLAAAAAFARRPSRG